MARQKKRRKGWLIALILVCIVLGIFAVMYAGQEEEAIQVEVEAVSKRTIVERVYASGRLFPATELEITSNVSGTLTKLYVKEGEVVKKGQLLARIDPDALVSVVERTEAAAQSTRAQLASIRAQRKQLEAQFANTEIVYRRNQQLRQEGVISQAEFDASEATYKAAKANLETADQNILSAEYNVQSSVAAVKEQKKNLSLTRIYAPINGVVSTLYKKQGEQVVGTAQMAGTPILKIANLNSVEIRVDVNERDILDIEINDSADIELDAYPERRFAGIVTQIANAATGLNNTQGAVALTSDKVTNFEVRILLLEESYQDLNPGTNQSPFRSGLSAFAEIKTNTASDILAIPVIAVTTRADKEAQKQKKPVKKNDLIKEYVFVLDADSVALRQVTTGIQDDEYIQIHSGLKGGEQVVKAPYDAIAKTLDEGDKVEVVEGYELYEKEEGR